MSRRRYLRKTGLQECLQLWLGHEACRMPLPAEPVATPNTLGRITAEAVFALRSVPHEHCSAMDGLAVTAASTFGASETAPVRLRPEDYDVVDTGDPIPEGRDTVIMVERVTWLPGEAAELTEASPPWQHIRLAGEDVAATEMLLPAGHRLRPPDIAALLSAGVREVQVTRRPRVTVLPTGDELVDAMAPPEALDRAGAIPETNSAMIAGFVSEWGGEARRTPPVADTREAVRAALHSALETCDVVAFNAGSSAGREDFVPLILAEEGELLAHGIDVMPGKPAALGVVGGKPVIAIPGYPVSAYVVCRELLRPLLYRLQGLPVPPRATVTARMGRKTASRLGDEEHVRVKAARVGGELVAAPLPRGASLLNSVVRADGIVRIPASTEGVEAGEAVEMEPLRPLEQIEQSILVLGSHDILLDLLSDQMSRQGADGAGPIWSLSSANVGSLGGLTALRRGECHLAGTHLIDESSGEYNVSWVRRLFPDGQVALIHLARRQQGLLVRPGNPRAVSSLDDIATGRVLFINRQRGSGTRQLLDFELGRRGIDPSSISGYDREAYTHLAVAAAVASGGADAGLGILAAARALNLEFVPVAEEQFELAVRLDMLEHPAVRLLLEVIDSRAFQETAAALGGYDLREAGARRL